MSALKGVPMSLSPELLYILANMGHGDNLVIADGNFPAENQGAEHVVRMDGMGVPDLLRDMLTLFPIDYGEIQAAVMTPGPDQPEPPIFTDYRRVLKEGEGREVPLTLLGRFEFYDYTKENAYAIIATGETAIYANLILVKGVIAPE